MPTITDLWRFGRLVPVTVMALVLAGSALAEPPPWSTSAKKNAGGTGDTHRCGNLTDSAAADKTDAPRISGAIVGVLVGGTIGLKMDRVDQRCIGQSLERGDDGKTIWWENAAAKARFGVTPTRSFKNSQGRYCREYRTTALVEGRIRQAFGTACQQPDGAWEQVS